MSDIRFFDQITYDTGSFSDSLFNVSETLLSYRGRKVEVFKVEGTFHYRIQNFQRTSSSFFKTALKTALCFTLIIPLLALSIKAYKRIQTRPTLQEELQPAARPRVQEERLKNFLESLPIESAPSAVTTAHQKLLTHFSNDSEKINYDDLLNDFIAYQVEFLIAKNGEETEFVTCILQDFLKLLSGEDKQNAVNAQFRALEVYKERKLAEFGPHFKQWLSELVTFQSSFSKEMRLRLAILQRDDLPEGVKTLLTKEQTPKSVLDNIQRLMDTLPRIEEELLRIQSIKQIDRQISEVATFYQSSLFQSYTGFLANFSTDTMNLLYMSARDQDVLNSYFNEEKITYEQGAWNITLTHASFAPTTLAMQNMTRHPLHLNACLETAKRQGITFFSHLSLAHLALQQNVAFINIFEKFRDLAGARSRGKGIPRGAKKLEIEGGDSEKIKRLKDRYNSLFDCF